ncbi:extracellular solute-binding protein [Paenibacillus glycanilyticus]|uniref:ABC transporter substrate-binding protein n=1 Tax=Paenibacillus glycanilyticus TaxID=126569 RepID=UPI00203F1507|nr:extracellular solute-binding protein [Paenibacillus glycanilyticus]MCM3631214.1 extracellular solute-binding protein [Paenibacillus glycanilyticus]
MNKKLGLGLSIALMTTLLGACGGNSNNNNSAASPTNAAAESASPATESASAPASEETEPVTISFMHFKSDATDGIAKIVEQFESENPNIKVDVQPVKFDDYATLLKTKLASGDIVDVFTLNAGSTTKLYKDGGYLEDLTDQEFMKTFDPGVLAEQATDGRNFIMPLNAGPIAVFYNKKIFADLGIEIPTTYDALIAAAQKIKDEGKTPFALGWKDGWPLGMWLSRDFPSNTVLVEKQTDFFDKLEKGEAKFADNPAAKTTIAHALDMFKYGNKDQLGVDYNGAVDMFAREEAAMMYMGTWPLPDIEKKNPELFATGMGYFPYPFSNDPALNKLEFNPDASIAVNSKSEHKEAAFKFLAYLASVPAANTWVENVKTLTYVKGASTDIAPAITELQPYFDNGQLYNSQVFITTTIDWTTQFSQYVQKVFFNKATAEDIIKDLDDWVAKNHK